MFRYCSYLERGGIISRYRVPCMAHYPRVQVRVACGMCPNRWAVYSLARLAARYGSETPLDDVLAGIAADCPYPRHDPGPAVRKPPKYNARCHAYFPDLVPPPRPPGLSSGDDEAEADPGRQRLRLARLGGKRALSMYRRGMPSLAFDALLIVARGSKKDVP